MSSLNSAEVESSPSSDQVQSVEGAVSPGATEESSLEPEISLVIPSEEEVLPPNFPPADPNELGSSELVMAFENVKEGFGGEAIKAEAPRGYLLIGRVIEDICPLEPDGICGWGYDVYASKENNDFYLVKKSAACEEGPCIERYGPFEGDYYQVKYDQEVIMRYAAMLRK